MGGHGFKATLSDPFPHKTKLVVRVQGAEEAWGEHKVEFKVAYMQ